MKNILLISFAVSFIWQSAQAISLECDVEHKTPTQTYTIDPSRNLFEDNEQFSSQEENGVGLKVKFSQPIFKVLPVIRLGDSSDLTTDPTTIQILDKNSTFFDIILDGNIFGEVKTDIMLNDLEHVYIREIEVNEEHRGKGIGSTAIDLLVQSYLKRFKIRNFGAQIKPDNTASIRAFEKNGFLTNGVPRLRLLYYVLPVKL